MRVLSLLAISLFLVSLVVGQPIGFPSGCPNDYHYCGDIENENDGCPFEDLSFCQNASVVCGDDINDECIQLVNNYCSQPPGWNDRGCLDYYCNGTKSFRCPEDGLCKEFPYECEIVYLEGGRCAWRDVPCPTNSSCPGQYYCGRNSTGGAVCRDSLYDSCPSSAVDRECPLDSPDGFYPCGRGLCSTQADRCDPPEGFNYVSCDHGEQFCGYQFFENRIFRDTIEGCRRNAQSPQEEESCRQQLVDYCSNTTDLGCCSPASGFPYQCFFFCTTDQQECESINMSPQNTRYLGCYPGEGVCPNGYCKDQFFCGDENDSGICRSTFNEPCPSNSRCPNGEYVCPYDLCSPRPDTCIVGPVSGRCNQGEHYCGSCPFGNEWFCFEIERSGLCENISTECLAFVDAYCALNPDDVGCCTTGIRCLTNGFCAQNQAECDSIDQITQNYSDCASATEKCNSPFCQDSYYCGNGVCRDDLYTRCPDGPCIGKFFCGYWKNEPLCSENPLLCSPPEVYEDYVPCGSGEHRCENVEVCPFANQTVCEQIGETCTLVVPDFRYFTPECRQVIDDYCAINPSDPGCCNGDKPHRCDLSFRCAGNANECTPSPFCFRQNETCPGNPRFPSPSDCRGGYSCGDGVCKTTFEAPCPDGVCEGQFWCFEDICTAVPGQCDPPNGNLPAPPPDCNNGGVTCSENETCVGNNFNTFICSCNRGFKRPILGGDCIEETEDTDELFGGCLRNEDCANNQICDDSECVCRNGFAWDGDRRECIETVYSNPSPPRPRAQCGSAGDPHYFSFPHQNGPKWFSFQGFCDYVLVKTPNFEVHTRNGQCSPSWVFPTVSCTKGIAVKIGSDVVEFFESGAQLNGSPILSFPVSVGTARVNYDFSQYSLVFSDTATIQYRSFQATVELPSEYFGNTEGLCGSWNNQTNDYQLRNGSLVTDVDAFGYDWEVPQNETFFTSTNEDCGVDWGTTSGPRSKRSFSCVTPIDEAIAACSEALNPPSPFDQCFENIDTSRHFRNCLFDYCEIGNVFPDIAQATVRTVLDSCSFEARLTQIENPTTPPPTTPSPSDRPTEPPSVDFGISLSPVSFFILALTFAACILV